MGRTLCLPSCGGTTAETRLTCRMTFDISGRTTPRKASSKATGRGRRRLVVAVSVLWLRAFCYFGSVPTTTYFCLRTESCLSESGGGADNPLENEDFLQELLVQGHSAMVAVACMGFGAVAGHPKDAFLCFSLTCFLALHQSNI